MRTINITDENGISLALTCENDNVGEVIFLFIDALYAAGFNKEEIQDELKYHISDEDFVKLLSEDKCCNKKCKK